MLKFKYFKMVKIIRELAMKYLKPLIFAWNLTFFRACLLVWRKTDAAVAHNALMKRTGPPSRPAPPLVSGPGCDSSNGLMSPQAIQTQYANKQIAGERGSATISWNFSCGNGMTISSAGSGSGSAEQELGRQGQE